MKQCRSCGKHKNLTDFQPEKRNRLDGRAATCRFCAREKIHLKRYGMNAPTLSLVLKKQKNLCAICKNPETIKDVNGKIRSLAIDHNHEDGKFRGLLCFSCNAGLGQFNDDIELMKSAISYLRTTSKKSVTIVNEKPRELFIVKNPSLDISPVFLKKCKECAKQFFAKQGHHNFCSSACLDLQFEHPFDNLPKTQLIKKRSRI